MKKFGLLLLIMLALKNECNCQKVDRYCIISFESWWPKHPDITVDLGKTTGPRDSTILLSFQKIYQSKSSVDILNEMAILGWTYLNSNFYSNVGYLTFKKSFELSEINLKN
jgi:hypothetical protein